MRTIQVNGNAVRKARELKGLSAEDVAALMTARGVPTHPDSLRNIELGRRQPSAKKFGALCGALRCKAKDLLSEGAAA